MKARLHEIDGQTWEQLEEKLSGFLNRWAEHDLMPQFKKRLTALSEDLTVALEKIKAMRDQVALGRPGPASPRSSIAPSHSAKPFVMHNATEISRLMCHQDAKLRVTTWDESKLRRIETEDLAATAFDCSDGLRAEFGNEKGRFLAYWRSLHRKETR